MRLLLINPRFPESFWSSKWALNEMLSDKRAVTPPLGLATAAALCPPHWEVETCARTSSRSRSSRMPTSSACAGWGSSFRARRSC